MKQPVSVLSDEELKAELSSFGFGAVPITGTTRGVLQKKLESFRSGKDTISKSKTAKKPRAETTAATPAVAAANNQNLADSSSSSRFDANFSFGGLNDSNASVASLASFKAPSTNTVAIKNRTPTPPRAQTGAKRTPLRQQTVSGGAASTSSLKTPYTSGGTLPKSGLFGQTSTSGAGLGNSIRYSRSSFGTGYGGTGTTHLLSDRSPKRYSTGTAAAFENEFGREEDEEDDHMESSRIVSPRSRFQPPSYGTNSGSFVGGGLPKPSSSEKLKKTLGNVWGFFSRPLGTSTPCTDTGHKNIGYASGKYKRHSPSSSFDSTDHFLDTKKSSPDVSHWISRSVIVFFIILFCAYLSRVHPEVVYNGLSATGDFIVATFHFLYNYAIMPIAFLLMAGLLIFGAYQLIAFRSRQKTEENRKLMLLVERITDIIHESGSSGVAEPHVRDMIMPPTKRSGADYQRWQEAARFINNEDSRIRTEIRLINGTECNVWIWAGAGKQRWQGTAVAQGSPMARIPDHALTRCMKLRGINFTANPIEREAIRKELLAKLRPVLPKHIGFISGAENVVYIMLKDLNDANRAFNAFHSHWFNGHLLTAKYVRDQRYLERFPEAGR